MEKSKSEIIEEMDSHLRKAQLVQEFLHQVLVNTPPPVPEPVQWDCQLLSEIVAEHTDKAVELRKLLESFV